MMDTSSRSTLLNTRCAYQISMVTTARFLLGKTLFHPSRHHLVQVIRLFQRQQISCSRLTVSHRFANNKIECYFCYQRGFSALLNSLFLKQYTFEVQRFLYSTTVWFIVAGLLSFVVILSSTPRAISFCMYLHKLTIYQISCQSILKKRCKVYNG